MKDYTPKNTVGGLTAKIESLVETLAKETNAARVSETMRAYLATCARFHNYSAHNIFLIWIQRPEASHVAGFHTWLKLHRYVKRGEEGIAILAPCTVKKNEKNPRTGADEEKSHLFFKVAYVFDISQTDGEPLPPAPAWSSSEQDEELNARLLSFAASKNINVTRQPLEGETKGESHGGLIVLAPDAGTQTLIHELAHELLHKGDQRGSTDRETRELEAEAVAYVVATAAGMDLGTSANYIALWNGNAKAITARLSRIQHAADEILNFILPQAQPETVA